MGGHGGCLGEPHGGMAAIAGWLGIAPEQLWRELAGKSLAQVAAAHGKERTELIAFLNEQVKARLDAAVSAGRLTRAEADARLAAHAARVEQMVGHIHGAMAPGAGGPGGPGPRR
jgi:hypothetical protein